MPGSATAIVDRLTPYLQSLARIVFGFLLLRHGMEQLLGYPEASNAARMSVRGVPRTVRCAGGVADRSSACSPGRSASCWR